MRPFLLVSKTIHCTCWLSHGNDKSLAYKYKGVTRSCTGSTKNCAKLCKNYDRMELTWDGEKSMIKMTVLVITDKIIVTKIIALFS